MIFADKLIQLRKKAGWSQEELAEQMDVTRQSVSKWEGAQAIPDIEKMLRLSRLFGVSMDYLVKDEIETDDGIVLEKVPLLRHVSMDEVKSFLTMTADTAKIKALAVFLCILSPICLFILGGFSQQDSYDFSENAAGGIGMIVLLIIVSLAVVIFMSCERKNAEFEYLQKEVFDMDYGVIEMLKKQKAQYRITYTRKNIIGTVLSIMALIPLFIGAIIDENNDMLMIYMLSVSFVIAGIGVIFFVSNGIIWAGYEKLLQEGDYSKKKKENQAFVSVISTIYWLIITAIYLSYSFMTNNWQFSWIIWVIGGLIYPIITMINELRNKRKG